MQVGKSTLIRSLVHHFSHQKIAEIKGPATVVTGKLSLHVHIFSFSPSILLVHKNNNFFEAV